MTLTEYQQLIDHYIAKANYHGQEAIFGDKKYRKFHEFQENNFDMLLVWTLHKMRKDPEVWKTQPKQ